MSGIDWPAWCAGAIVGAYWARVLRLVVKSRRATGRAANFVPPERLGRLLRIVWYPTVLAWITIPFYVAFFSVKAPAALRRLYDEPFSQWVGVVLAAAALGATLVCWKRMGSSWRMGIDPSERTRLIITGPYAYVRHPIYALSSVMMVATVLVVPAPAMIVVALVHLSFLQWEARREERHLVGVHGAPYAAYMRRVGRFVPRTLTPYESGSGSAVGV
jgi:protein-S-isoprenylcysteine O-methyltransferase Ste14